MKTISIGRAYPVEAKLPNSEDRLRGLQFLDCAHVLLGRRVTGIDVDLKARGDITFSGGNGDTVAFGGTNYDVSFMGDSIRYVNIENRESQLYKFDGDDRNGQQLQCSVIDCGQYFMLKISGTESYVGIEKFDSGWYLTVSPHEKAALFHIQLQS